MNKNRQLLDAVLNASLDGLIALSEAAEKPYATAVFSGFFPGWEKLRYSAPLDVVRDFYLKFVCDVDGFVDLIAEVRRTRELREERIRLLDGRILHVIGRIVKTPDGSETEVWTHRDITEQCRQNEQLQLRLQLITTILDASSDAILTLVEGLEVPMGNAKYSSIFPGWEEALRYGQPLWELEDFYSRYVVDWEKYTDLTARVRRTGQLHQGVFHLKDGRIIHRSGKVVNTALARHRTLEIYTIRDITEEVR
ncbi:MAG: hypothetical protein LBB66_03900, partial [Desulfovibrio sp.]|nr:hypothetical protein [Desulfovibrio sp.]